MREPATLIALRSPAGHAEEADLRLRGRIATARERGDRHRAGLQRGVVDRGRRARRSRRRRDGNARPRERQPHEP